MVHVKICGVTTGNDARACVALGASAIGLNFVAGSPRRLDASAARVVSRAVHAADAARAASAASSASTGRVIVVGVVANMSLADMRALVDEAELDCLQLHGDETAELLAALLPHAYKAVRVANEADVALARAYPGEHILVDAKVEGALGGTGKAFDWSLVRDLARERRLTLAGGLHPENVARAVAELRPYCVDVASGVEGAPGEKDLTKVKAFIDAARGA